MKGIKKNKIIFNLLIILTIKLVLFLFPFFFEKESINY